MSKPIQEPILTRKLRQQQYGIDQLFRRPAPVGSGAPIAFRALFGYNLTVATASETQINWTDWENEDSTVYGEITTGGGDLTTVQFKQVGWYGITMGHIWDPLDDFDAVHGVLLLDGSTTTGNWPFGETGNMGAWHNGPNCEQFCYPPILSVVRKYPLYTTTESEITGGVYGAVLAKAYQNSGINRTLEAAWLDIVFFGNSLNVPAT